MFLACRCPVDYQMDITEGLNMFTVSTPIFIQDRDAFAKTGIKDNFDNFSRALNLTEWLHMIPTV